LKYRIRFNKSRGQPNRGTKDHVWRVFDETGKEMLCKYVWLLVPSKSEKEEHSEDYNIVCDARIEIDRETSTIKFYPDNTI